MADNTGFNKKDPLHWLAFGFGSGLAPKAPGTFGTMVGVLFYLWLQYLPLFSYLVVVLVTFVIGVEICTRVSLALGVKDHPGIVWDEMVGYWVTMIAAPAGIGWMFLGFVLFRIFDIFKPWPVSWADQKVSGGLGIMLDDLLAGIMAALSMALIAWMYSTYL